MKPAYRYAARVVSVYDGDTIRADIDCGFGIWKLTEVVRLSGIQAPEVRGPSKEAGLKSKAFLANLIEGREVTIETIRLPREEMYKVKDKKGGFGRVLGTIYLDGASVNDIMLIHKHAIEYKRR